MGTRIVASAIKLNGIVYTGLRHGQIIGYLADAGFPTPIDGEQGFIDDEGIFYDRQAAGSLAITAGQISHLRWPGMGLDSSEVFIREERKSIDLRDAVHQVLSEWDILPSELPFNLESIRDWLHTYMDVKMQLLHKAFKYSMREFIEPQLNRGDICEVLDSWCNEDMSGIGWLLTKNQRDQMMKSFDKKMLMSSHLDDKNTSWLTFIASKVQRTFCEDCEQLDRHDPIKDPCPYLKNILSSIEEIE